MNRTLRTILVYGVGVVFMVVVAQTWFETGDKPAEITTSEFIQDVEAGKIEEVTMFTRSDIVAGEYVDKGETSPDFTFSYPPEYEGTLTEVLVANDVPMFPESDTSVWEVVISLLPWLFLIGFMIFIFTQMQGGGNRVMQFGKAKAKQVTRDTPKVTFDDVAGVEEAIEELEEIKEFLQNPAKFRAMGAKIPKGVLLYGPPGTGKTLLARAIAGEAGVPFFSISGSDFVEMFVGVGASRVRDLFEQAKAQAPAIIFIDEIDAVGRHRGAGLGGGHDEREQTLNQLLVELDGFDVNTGVIVIAGTNRPDILDPALLRPGRFDRQIVVDRPDLKGRQAILAVHSRGKPLDDKIDIAVLARQTAGFTGADLANLINEAAILAARRDKNRVGMEELEEAIDRVIAGPERKSRVISESERKLTAYHEGGHALVGFALPNLDPIHKVTIIPRGRSGGYTMALPTEDRFFKRRSEMVDELAYSLGGRTAEELVFGDPSTGASNDIDTATDLARKMVMEYGMSDRLGPMKYGKAAGEVFLGRDYSRQPDYSDEVASFIDAEVRKLISQAHDEARQILTTHEDALHRIAAELMDKETVDAAEVAEIFFDVPKWEHTADGAMRIQMPNMASSEDAVAAVHITTDPGSNV
jgi:cell division protease FtsH